MPSVHAAGLIALGGGLVALHGTAIGGDPLAALAGAAGQLPLTLTAAVLVGAATALNLAAGAVAVRLLLGTPFDGLRQAVLAGLAGAVIVDFALMAVLGSGGAFVWPALIAVQLALVALGLRARPLLRRPIGPLLGAGELGAAARRWPLAVLLILLVWSGPATLTLASPVVPFLDVLPNQVAPVEHLRAFGTLASLDMTPSPIYGPSRIFLGYQALLGAIATSAGVSAPLAVAAFALALLLLVAVAGHGLAGAIGGRAAANWALLLVPLSVTFLRLADARAGVLAFALLATVLWLTIEPPTAGPPRRALLLVITLAAALLVHPLIGLLGVGSLGLLAVVRPERYGEAMTIAVVAVVASVPQWAVMAGLSVPPLAAPAAFALAAIVLAAMVAAGAIVVAVARTLRRVAFGAVLLAGGLVLVGAALDGAIGSALLGRDWLGEYPVLLAGATLGALLGWRRDGMDVLACALLATMLAGLAAALLPGDELLVAAVRFEVPKSLAYFAPTLLALAAAVGLAELWRRRWPLALRALLAGAIVVVAAAPLRPGVVDALSLGEHRLAESLAISWRNAAQGYWQGFPDPRMLIDAEQAELVDALRGEIRAGRLRASDEVLHVAGSFQPWASTPLAPFAGVIETTATTDPEDSIHTHGGRLRDVTDLVALLGGRPAYVVLEPDGLPATVRTDILAAGYEPLFANPRGEVFAPAD